MYANPGRTDATATGAGVVKRLVPVAVVGVAAFAGMATAIVGGHAGFKAVYYAFVFGLLGAGGLLAVTREEPIRLVYFALLLGFPVANALVPPGRVGLKIFDVVSIFAALALLVKFASAAAGQGSRCATGGQ